MPRFYLLINEAGVYTKVGAYFESQGGLEQPWGQSWESIEALDLYDARNQGIKLRRERFPNCHRTLGEDGEPPESYWPEAKPEASSTP
ncbi:hypothetical protein [Bradyrhizobium sp. SRS-191]|uniref:hypothetical protein n=1 Tax=Bradyrhizobium sp. SRS-191 TaxID=2962606 RepID=UPI00211F21E9|nr:hypothetical protein [Bradyrhizobium sp. SRS-191]